MSVSPFTIKNLFLGAGWPEKEAILGALKFSTAEAARSVLATKVPEDIRAMMLRDSSMMDDAAVKAFQDAAEMVFICGMDHVRPLPQEDRDPRKFFCNGRPMLAECRTTLQNALADRDEHIDTSQPQSAKVHALGGALSIVDRAALVRIYGEEGVQAMENRKSQ